MMFFLTKWRFEEYSTSNDMSKIKNLIIAASIILTQPSVAAVNVHAHESKPTRHVHETVVTDEEDQKMILYYINAYRSKHHLAPLKLNHAMSQEAAKHSRDMASHAMPFGHTGFNSRIKRLYKQIGECRGGAENVAFWRIDAKKLVDGWVASPGHRRNIEGNYNLTGIGIAHGKKGWAYYTQIFLRTDGTKFG
jgi:uncharacterized protein YkwD